jgi:hypothetical protein
MESSGAKPNPTATPATGTPAPGVTEELGAIDTTSLDRLLEIRKEESRLEEYLARAEQMRQQVKEVVWRRVMNDYTKRVATYEEQATPLRAQVRAEYQKLRALFDRVRTLKDDAELEKSELEFRHAVGELGEEQLQDALRRPGDALEQCRLDLAAIEEQKARFLSAFGSEAELELPAASGRATAAVPVPTGAVAKPKLATGTTAAKLSAAVPLAEPDATRIVSADELAGMGETGKAAAKKPGKQDTAERTFLLPAAAGLLISIDGAPPRDYRLSATTYLGRSDENQVQIARPGVSRQHALISAEVDGFKIKDLQSQNGTFVNGERITERPLKDGDQIVVGDAIIVFRTPWPVPTARPPGGVQGPPPINKEP